MAITITYPTIEILERNLGVTLNDYSKKIGDGFACKSANPKDAKMQICPDSELKMQEYFASFLKSYRVAGLDLPILITDSTVTRTHGVIAILAQDPLRNENDYKKLSAKCGKNILVSLPFALQTKIRNAGCYVVRAITEKLLKCGWCVYVTDINKLYAAKEEKQVIKANERLLQLYRKILMEELNQIKPRLVLLMGKTAQEAFGKLKIGAKIIKIPHPSGSANHAWTEIIKGKATNENKVNYTLDIITKYTVRPFFIYKILKVIHKINNKKQ